MILTYLDLSTGHLTDATRMLLDDYADHQRAPHSSVGVNGWPAMTVAAYGLGFFVTVPDAKEQDLSGLPYDLVAVMRHAQRTRVPLLRFDSDGDTVGDLPRYEDGPYRPELARADRLLSADELREKYSTACNNGEHPRYLRVDWRDAVANDTTLVGYWQWVEDQIEQEET